ncbi:G-type lectin S-receptor-like serine/threonine-protein kinase LECRK1 [Durio zibethinus]|uniref:Receptor-like serine/threonine-protein kinase n=1 Tax=Durio zibethinus TaxID=66656 RepID=A0A6P5ZEN4_DURZI|nr:G-type lectin S-receptor-like serine/threonine-protein kinase LECRK1 [Durio zibethinus]
MTSMPTVLLLLSFLCLAKSGVQEDQRSHITPGSIIYPNARAWPSPSGRFAFGFYEQDNGFRVGIWLLAKRNKIVWTANRDDPALPFTSKATLKFTEDGKLVLTNELGEMRLIANVTASSASMLDSGNFVLYDKHKKIIWESFQYPTDTILGGQNLYPGSRLFSSVSETNYSAGRFHLEMQEDGNLVLYPMYTDNTGANAYWSSKTFGTNTKFHLYLNSTGLLQLINETDSSIYNTLGGASYSSAAYRSPLGYHPYSYYNNQNKNTTDSIIYRATLDVDGIFRLYSHIYNGSGEVNESVVWYALKDTCDVNGYCGFNSYCTYNDYQPTCLCLPGTDFVDQFHSIYGCKRNYTEAQCKSDKANAHHFSIETMENMVWEDTSYSKEPMSVEECSRSCLEDCNCEAALFKGGICMKQKLPLRYAKRDFQSEEESRALLKVGKRRPEEHDIRPIPPPKLPVYHIKSQKVVVEVLLLTFSLVTFSCVFLTIFGLFVYKFRVLRYKRLLEDRNWGLTKELTLQLFSYDQLRKATNGFKEELGKGSFGAVYKGTLYKGRETVAVKRLEKLIEEGEREFQAEMRAIGRTHHRNLVRLLGYCAEDSKRLLVYEYMANGSLANLLFKATRRPDWNERIRIALDVARAILYLHEECETSIIHCDIKPQNILMDDTWTAKISDFGLAKLLMGDQTRTFTGARGTRGYMAPEWQKNTPISVKADIYSFGIVLLEIICCRRNLDTTVSKTEEIILSTWVYRCFVEKRLDKVVLGEEVDKKNLERMVMVALWCIQDEPALRPCIKSVVMMLEGITDISIPPCPTASLSSM